MEDREYAGFWIRTGASLIDSMLVLIITGPILTMIYGEYYWRADTFVVGGWDLLCTYILPAIAVIAFWIYKSATPGKIATKLVIVDAQTGGKPSSGQFIGRYLAYYVSILPLCLGLLWIAFDSKKQGWHDKLAGTVVLRNYLPEPAPVPFEVEA